MLFFYISLQKKFHIDIFIFGLVLTYKKKLLVDICIVDTFTAFGKQLFHYKNVFPITFFFTPINEF